MPLQKVVFYIPVILLIGITFSPCILLDQSQSVLCFGFLPTCQMLYVKSSGLWHCLCVFPVLLKNRTFCITLKKYFSSACFSCSNSERIPLEPPFFFFTYFLSHIWWKPMKYDFFSFLKLEGTHTYTDCTKPHQPYYWLFYNSKLETAKMLLLPSHQHPF